MMTTEINSATPQPSRRDVLIKGAIASLAFAGTWSRDGIVLASVPGVTRGETPGVEEGPFWVDGQVKRVDVRSDASTDVFEAGLPVYLGLTISQLKDTSPYTITPLVGAQVDLWNCNAQGVYSDEASENTTGSDYLRGYQVTNAHGVVNFLTNYPGWYSGDSAVAGTDYTSTSGTLTFAPGTTSETVTVTVLGETTTDTDKTFTLNLTNPTNATITSNSATGDILYASGTPSISVAAASDSVPTSGTSNLVFTVSLSNVSANTVTVNYATVDGTALAGTDYTVTSGTLTFAPGTTSETVTVPVTGESGTVTSKTLSLDLSGATNTSNTTGTATGTLSYVVSGQPNDITDNLANTTGGVETATGTTEVAASFTTGTSAFTLDTATLLLDAATAGAATVAIYSDAGLQPGTLLETLSTTSTITSTPADIAFTSTGTALAANTTYWIVLSAASGAYDWSWTSTDTGSGIGFTDTWAESTDSGTTWFAYNSSPTQMSVIATAS